MQKWHAVFKLLCSAKARVLVSLTIREFIRRAYSNERFYGYYFDLSQDYKAPKPPFPLTIRKFERDDFPRIIGACASTTREDMKKLIELQIQLLEGMPTCYGGFTLEGNPCCMCWLVDYADNDKLRSFLSPACPT